MSLTKVSYSMINGAPYNAVDYGADVTGTDDSTTAIQAALDAAGAAGGGVVVLPAGTFKYSLLVMKYANVALVGQGSSTILLSTQDFTTAHRPNLWIAANNCTVDSIYFTYQGWDSTNLTSLLTTRPSANSYFGSQISVGYINLYTTPGSGTFNTVYGVTLSVIYNTTIRNVKTLGSAIHAITLLNAVNNSVENCDIQQFKGTGIWGYNAPQTIIQDNNLQISGDDAVFIGSNSVSWSGYYTPLTGVDMVDVSITNNYCAKIGAKGFCAPGYNTVVIANNVVNETRAAAIWIGEEPTDNTPAATQAQITGNALYNCFGSFGTAANGYYYTTDIVTATSGIFYAISADSCTDFTVGNNVVSLSSKITTQIQSTRYGFGNLNIKRVSVCNNIFSGFVRGNIGAETAITPVASDVNFTGNIVDALDATNSPRLVQVGYNADTVKIVGNNFRSIASATGGFAIIYNLTGAKSFSTSNSFDLPNGVAAYSNGGITLVSNQDTYDVTPTSNIAETSISRRVFWLSAAPSAGTWNQGDQVWNTAPSSGGAPGWVCTAAGTPGTWKAMANLA